MAKTNTDTAVVRLPGVS